MAKVSCFDGRVSGSDMQARMERKYEDDNDDGGLTKVASMAAEEEP